MTKIFSIQIICIFLLCIFVITVTYFQFFKCELLEGKENEALLRARLDGSLPQDHAFVSKVIKQEFIGSVPSKEARDPFTELLTKKSNSQYGQDMAVIKLLNGLTNGFFVEAGAGHGGQWSNSLFFELKYDWTGLLIEGNPRQYKRLAARQRHAYSVHSCLSTAPYPEKLMYRTYVNHTGLAGLVNGERGPHDVWQGKKLTVEDTTAVQCFPLYSLLLALGNPTVHYFSLDVEGAELKILKTIPWEKVDIKILTVEVAHSDAQSIVNFMKVNNYFVHSRASIDYIFVKKGFNVTH